MTPAIRKEGPGAPLFYPLVVAAVFAAGTASAQNVERSDLELCAGLETAELKLACFEALIATSKSAESAADRESAPAESLPSGTPPASGPAAAPQDDFGSEYVEQTDEAKEREVFAVTVTEVRRARDKRLYFHFANGHVWRQMEYGYIQYPKEGEFDAVITRGMMGDYRLRVGGKGRMTRIVRVK